MQIWRQPYSSLRSGKFALSCMAQSYFHHIPGTMKRKNINNRGAFICHDNEIRGLPAKFCVQILEVVTVPLYQVVQALIIKALSIFLTSVSPFSYTNLSGFSSWDLRQHIYFIWNSHSLVLTEVNVGNWKFKAVTAEWINQLTFTQKLWINCSCRFCNKYFT